MACIIGYVIGKEKMYYEIEQSHVNMAFSTILKELFVTNRRAAGHFKSDSIAIWAYSSDTPVVPQFTVTRIGDVSVRSKYFDRVNKCLTLRGFLQSDRFGMNSYSLYARDVDNKALMIQTFIKIADAVAELAIEEDLLVVFAIHLEEMTASCDPHIHIFFGAGSVPAVQALIDDIIYESGQLLKVKGEDDGDDLWFDP